MNDAVTQWLNSALMDLRSIEKIMDDFFLTPIACFHAQQNQIPRGCGDDAGWQAKGPGCNGIL